MQSQKIDKSKLESTTLASQAMARMYDCMCLYSAGNLTAGQLLSPTPWNQYMLIHVTKGYKDRLFMIQFF